MTGGGAGEGGLHVRVEGVVQGVGYRRFVERIARELGLAGWARNLSDGAVEVLAAGPADALAELRRRLQEGPRHAEVARLVDLPPVDAAAPLPFALLRTADAGAPVDPSADR